jgi:signal transduction histidine kinase/HAMP domain-containing protein
MAGRLRLRHKLGAAVGLAALLPVAVASILAARLVLGSLEGGVRTQTDRTLRVGVNLVLRMVQQAGNEAVQLAENPQIEQLLERRPDRINQYLVLEADRLPQGLIEVADAAGKIVGRYASGEPGRVEGIGVGDRAEAVQRALAFERRVTLEVLRGRPAFPNARAGAARSDPGDRLVMRASAPVVTEALALRGAVVVSMPLDDNFGDLLKAAIVADIVIHAGAVPSASTFVGEGGRRLKGIAPPPGVAAQVLGQGSVHQARAFIEGREYSFGYAPLQDTEGHRVGMLGVAVEREPLRKAKSSALFSVSLGSLIALFVALVIAGFFSRGITTSIQDLHKGARAVARGDLDYELPKARTSDEIGGLTDAFSLMTIGLKEHQERLAARMREITTLHEIGRAVSSVLSLDDVLGKIVGEVAGVLDATSCVLLLSQPDGSLVKGSAVGVGKPDLCGPLAAEVARSNSPLRVEAIEADGDLGPAAEAAGLAGSLLAVPLELKDAVLGVLLVTRPHDRPFTEADLRLVATFGDQAAAAMENARLYQRVMRFSEELEEKVKARTRELTLINQELGRTLSALRDTQIQLIQSERMAGLGLLVAGVAHDINSPAAAIQGAADSLAENVVRLLQGARLLGEVGIERSARKQILDRVDEIGPRLMTIPVESPATVRRLSRELAVRLRELGVESPDTEARTLVECGAADIAEDLLRLGGPAGFKPVVRYLEEYAWVLRNSQAIKTAIRAITQIVRALKSYSHLDQEAAPSPIDIHEGIENTLVILNNQVKYGIIVNRRYAADLPAVPVYVDELNQVWTNLLHNAVQALGGKGEITIETAREAGNAAVRIIDNGPGIPPEVMPRIFEPFFTTKPKGEGSGLGLGIVRRIVQKHGGSIEVASEPGRTCFTVKLPLDGPKVQQPQR